MDSTPTPEKRQSPDDQTNNQSQHPCKRQRRTSTLEPELETSFDTLNVVGMDAAMEEVERPTAESMARDGLRRSIVLALEHVGFESASREALESLTSTTETYLVTFVAHLKQFAESARREYPTPDDFAYMLRKHNVPISSLKPHLKNPVAKEKLEPEYYDPIPILNRAEYFRTPSNDFLGAELDGNADKKDKAWIPDGLPSFPSKHTYMFTPVEAKPVDPEKKRAEATADAQKGEKALRRINRATKLSQQKELKEIAQRNSTSRQRHSNWEAMMKAMIPQRSIPSNDPQELADHSVIVNATGKFLRKEVPKVSNRGLLDVIASRG
ncbi:bromodomain associated domain protein [Xylariales sp. AK1849]|nr:bromodomain associated domain protein [Xylariales sp. AK1849]